MQTATDRLRLSYRLRLNKLEVARAHDGVLRGPINPWILVGIYERRRDGQVLLIGRERFEVAPERGLVAPYTMPLGGREQEISLVHATQKTSDILLLVTAFERDDGADVAAGFADLGIPERLSLWSAESEIGGIADWQADEGRIVEVTIGSPSDCWRNAKRDKWVGAAIGRYSLHFFNDEATNPLNLRFPFHAENEKNMWAALASIRVENR